MKKSLLALLFVTSTSVNANLSISEAYCKLQAISAIQSIKLVATGRMPTTETEQAKAKDSLIKSESAMKKNEYCLAYQLATEDVNELF